MALARRAQSYGPGQRTPAAGLGEVLELLSERRVQTLLVAEGFSAPS